MIPAVVVIVAGFIGMMVGASMMALMTSGRLADLQREAAYQYRVGLVEGRRREADESGGGWRPMRGPDEWRPQP